MPADRIVPADEYLKRKREEEQGIVKLKKRKKRKRTKKSKKIIDKANKEK